MHISLHQKNTTEASITIKLEEADYQPHVAKRIKEYSKKANIKGFRPGNVPSALIQQIYGQSILVDEVHSLIADSLLQYLQEKEIHTLGGPMPVGDQSKAIDWENQGDFEFEYTIGMAGAFNTNFSKDIRVTEYKVTSVTDQTIHEVIEQLRKTYGNLEVVEKSTVDDIIHGELRYPAQEFKVQTKIAIGELDETLRKAFIGLTPNATITFDVKYLLKNDIKLPGITDTIYEAMRNLEGQAEFSVKQIHRIVPAALDQEFFDKVLGKDMAATEKECKEGLREGFIQSKQQEAQGILEQSIQTALLNKAAIALPDDFLKRWLKHKNSTLSKEQIESYYPQYAQELRWSLLMERVSKEHNLELTPEELEEEIKQRFRAAFDSTELSQQLSEEEQLQLMDSLLQANNGRTYNQIYERIYARNLLNFIKEQITIVTKEVSAEEFAKLVLQ